MTTPNKGSYLRAALITQAMVALRDRGVSWRLCGKPFGVNGSNAVRRVKAWRQRLADEQAYKQSRTESP